MTVFTVLVLFLVAAKYVSSDDSVRSTLLQIQAEINNDTTPFCYHAHSNSKQAFVSNAYHKYMSPSGTNALVYPFCLVTHELGNRLGNYFTELGCAEASGLHFIAVHKQFDIKGSYNGNSTTLLGETERSRLAFLNALPDVVVHPHPVSDRSAATHRVQHACKCTRYCWQHSNAAWVNRTASIRTYIRAAVSAYLKVLNTSEGTQVSHDVDLSNAPPNHPLPLIPNVALQYRCGDNIGFSYLYGILPFTAFDDRIPANAKTIYVLSDHPSRAVHSPYSTRCQTILQALFEYLQKKFPKAIIVVKRGGDLFLDYARLTMADVTICSASTYCFWPAVANEGTVHFPVTSLIAGADSIELAPNFGPRFNWINEPKIISNFKNIRPWTAIVDVLTGVRPAP